MQTFCKLSFSFVHYQFHPYYKTGTILSTGRSNKVFNIVKEYLKQSFLIYFDSKELVCKITSSLSKTGIRNKQGNYYKFLDFVIIGSKDHIMKPNTFKQSDFLED